MRKLGTVIGVVGGMLCIIGGMSTHIDPAYIKKFEHLVYFISPTYSGKIVEVIKNVMSYGGISIIAGALIGGLFSRTAGIIVMVLGVIGGLIPSFTIISSAYSAGIFSKSLEEIVTFAIQQGKSFIGVLFTVVAIFFIKK